MAEEQEVQEIKEQMETDKFPCKACGGNMVFDPESGSLSCAYCGNKIVIPKDTSAINEYDFTGAEENIPEEWARETRVIKCDGCGAETVLGANETAQFCAFCGSSHIVKNGRSAGIAPESLIPFKVTEKNAKQLFSDWIKKKFFAPKALKSNYQLQRLKGLYLPCWTYDSETFSAYTGEGGTYYYVTQTRTVMENGKQVTKTEQVRKIRWWPTSGNYSKFFNDLPVYATKQVDAGLLSQLEPFDTNELTHYKPEYLSGFYAERYSVGLEEGWQKVREFVDDRILSGVIDQINADETRNIHINTAYNNIKYKLIMLPTWISAYKYKEKAYTFMVNGQTGKVSGHAPLSILKILLLIGLGLAVIALAYFLLSGQHPGTVNLPGRIGL